MIQMVARRVEETAVEQVVDLYRRLGRAVRAGEPADWAAGLTLPQLRVLWHLARVGAASVGEVAVSLGVTQPSATAILDRLVCKQYVQRESDPTDRRVVRNVLTPAGRELLDRVWEGRRALLDAALERLSVSERAVVMHGLSLLCNALESLPIPQPPTSTPDTRHPTPNAHLPSLETEHRTPKPQHSR